MKKVYAYGFNIISPLGNTAQENFNAVLRGETGVKQHHMPDFDEHPFHASLINAEWWKTRQPAGYTRFESLIIASVSEALKQTRVNPVSHDTVLIVSSTKGNIELADSGVTDPAALSIAVSAEMIARHFSVPTAPLVISNACISGVQALVYARRLLAAGKYSHAIVTGADLFSRFIFSGFKSFQALSPGKCRPFAEDRDGINLGEAAATVILTTEPQDIEVPGGAITNDSNHISGPSRTGEELAAAIDLTLQQARLKSTGIDFISAHGTATLYNDEMESKAFALCGLSNTPVNSLKGYFGHTLGAAGLVESVLSMLSLKNDLIAASAGFTPPAVGNLNVCRSNITGSLKHCLKTASGFGGGNAAVIFSKNSDAL